MKQGRAKWYAANRERLLKKAREYYVANKARSQSVRRKRKYGLTQSDYDKLLARQRRRCAICRRLVGLLVDHCHRTKKVRGLICKRCNTALGQFKDSIPLLKIALQYRRRAA